MVYALAGSLVIAVTASLAGPGNVLFSDDFNDGDTSAWTEVNALAPLGGTTFDASGGAYEFESNIELPPLPFYVGDGVLLDESADNKSYRHCAVRFTVRLNNENTNIQLAGRANPETPGASYIAFNYQGHLGIFINVIPDAGSPGGSPPIAEAPFVFDIGRDYIVLATMHGARLSMKVWAADQPEPSRPQIAVNETRFQQQTGVALIMFNQPTFQPGGTGGRLSVSFDNVVITRDN
ncbi:MAG: hypothetical protein IT436_04060 [Phycisphaerales bacterium]|nr:hypothetical protein [Phycisphaerales bacterium]